MTINDTMLINLPADFCTSGIKLFQTLLQDFPSLPCAWWYTK